MILGCSFMRMGSMRWDEQCISQEQCPHIHSRCTFQMMVLCGSGAELSAKSNHQKLTSLLALMAGKCQDDSQHMATWIWISKSGQTQHRDERLRFDCKKFAVSLDKDRKNHKSSRRCGHPLSSLMYHEIIEWVMLKDHSDHSLPNLCHGEGHLPPDQMLKNPFRLALSTSRDEATTTLGSLCQGQTDLVGTSFFLLSFVQNCYPYPVTTLPDKGSIPSFLVGPY